MRTKRWLLVLSLAVVVAGAATTAGVLLTSGSSSSRGEHELAFTKGDPDAAAAGNREDAANQPNEQRSPDSTYEAQQGEINAYPADSVPFQATLDAQSAWAALVARSKASSGQWQLIGPDKATYPGVLNVLGDGAQYVTSGRVTALALVGNSCTTQSCTLLAAAAGGGVWKTTKALSGSPGWTFTSGSFLTNAIGSLVVDPNDASHQTVYAATGEPNASADSEAGMGIYKSTDGGSTWSLLSGSTIFQARSLSSIQIAPNGDILVGVTRGVRGASSVSSGGATTNPPGALPLGLYRSTNGGASFSSIWNGAGSIRGVNEVRVDPNTPTVLYASAFQQGVYRSLDNGATWAQIHPPVAPTQNTDRAEFAVAKLAGGKTRMYVGDGAVGGAPAVQARFYRTDDAAGAAVFTDMTTAQNRNYCTGQCWYDNVVYSPPGHPDMVYLLGSFDYGSNGASTNARAVLLSTDAGATFTDMTKDADPSHSESIHPDQHAIVVNPSNPLQFFDGSDGGVVRTDGNTADVSSKCDARGLAAADLALCKSLLARVPNQIASLNEGLSTLQFQSLSVSPKRPQNNLQGGTQDNGTFQFTGSKDVAYQEIYGDGGQSGYSAADDGLRFNTFTGQATDVNFRNGDPTKWVIATGPIVSSPEGAYFYPPVTADPNPANGGTIFQGSQSVWRTQDWGGNRDFLEANCPEFTTSAANPSCGDFTRIGPAGATDLTSAAYGNRAGGFVAAIERAPSNTGTLWVATGAGRVFVSDNSDAAAGAVTFTRIDNLAANSPGRFVSSIYVDPANPHHAWISYSGYNFNTPGQPGHVFEVTYTGATATWTNLDGGTGPLGDLPVTDLVRDDVTGVLYAATDFGVAVKDGSGWSATQGMPMVETPGLTIVPSARVLYAATHGRGAWQLNLP